MSEDMNKDLWMNKTREQILEDLKVACQDAISGKGKPTLFIDICNHYMVKIDDTPEKYRCFKCGFSC